MEQLSSTGGRPALACGVCLVIGVASVVSPASADCEWVLRSPAAHPSERHGQAMAYDSNRARYVLVGGRDTVASPAIWYRQTWEYDGSTWVQGPDVPIAPTLEGLAQSAFAFDSVRNVSVMYGYSHAAGRSSETWEYDGTSWVMRASSSGIGFRNRAAMAFDSARGRSVFFGGEAVGNNPRGDTWEWNGTSWTSVATTGPSPRFGHAMAYDAARGVTVLFGGRDRAGFPNGLADTWVWDGVSWVQPMITGAIPPARQFAAMAYDATREVVVLFGGHDGVQSLGDTWEWNGTQWTLVANAGGVARDNHAMAWGPDGVVMFGGFERGGGTVLGDTWVYECNGVQPCYADCNGDEILSVDDFTCFINEFASAQALPHEQQVMHYANCDGSTTAPALTVDDFTCFINAFAAGCP